MTKQELILKLIDINLKSKGDTERDHSEADDLLLEYIDDPTVTNVFNEIDKWYS